VGFWDICGGSNERLACISHGAEGLVSRRIRYPSLGRRKSKCMCVNSRPLATGLLWLTALSVARANGLTPFSVYQGKWNAAYRDMEAEIIPMCQDEGLAVVPWAALGGGALLSGDQRKMVENNPKARKAFVDERSLQVSAVLEEIASRHKTSLQSVVSLSHGRLNSTNVFAANEHVQQALAYLYSQTPYVVPIVGVQTVAHVNSMLDHLKIRLSCEDIRQIHDTNPLTPLFPMNFLFNYRRDQPYHLGLTAKDNQQYQMAAVIDSPRKQQWY